MRRSHGFVQFCVIGSLIASACSEPSPNADEVGDSESGESDDVATFTTSEGDGDGDPTDESTDASTSESTDASTDESTSESTTDAPETETETATETSATESTSETTDSSSSETETSESTDATTADDEPPSVVATNPSDLQTGIAPGVKLEVTFSEVMDPATLTTNVADESCTGTLQVSSNDFATCVRMNAAPNSPDDQTFSVTPAVPLESATTYQFRVLGQVTDAGGTAMVDDFTSANGFVIRYFHTITIDGINDFTAVETFVSSSMGHTGYVAWDDAYVYLGMDSPDLAGNSNQVWWVAYLGGPMGTTTGVLYNTQQPALSFDARWHLRWKASDDYGGALEWTGVTWVDPGFGPNAGSDDVDFGASFVEVRVAWSDIGSPDTLGLHMGMLREQAFSEACWAAIPGGSYIDGYDPDYSQSYEFDLLGSTVPVDHTPI